MAMDIEKRHERLTARITRINDCVKREKDKGRIAALKEELEVREAELKIMAFKVKKAAGK